MPERLKVVILGSTGSIGRQAVEVCARYQDRIEVVGLTAYAETVLLAKQAEALGVTHTVLSSVEGPAAVAALAKHPRADLVLNALVGAAGLESSYAALKAGKVLALANKESLVVGGELLMPLVEPGRLLPVDSEHSALFQCLRGEEAREVANLWITASGGPFRGRTRAELAAVTPAEALAHPNWKMGPKISIDSATLMNKGLEVIEAHHLFAQPYRRIQVVQHPQSRVHSLVEYVDGSFKAHLGVTDMRIPIQYALSYPERWPAIFDAAVTLDLREMGSLDFSAPDTETFGCLRLALEAGKAGGTMPCVLNAANEVAVAAFLDRRMGFLDIERVVGECLEQHECEKVQSLEQLQALDTETRARAQELV
ncbi:MAG: 1-deoxy-D-xylulose-5-phosphate reductoisomerase [Coriobacteriales bacterium]|jgi:1-deoxy-D-xylulose-5-phosphate reductoisomerase|nr:1-deoxy-D-xylulose-5-phosphate reductoisomerase [Coriobacteriales bacterium]